MIESGNAATLVAGYRTAQQGQEDIGSAIDSAGRQGAASIDKVKEGIALGKIKDYIKSKGGNPDVAVDLNSAKEWAKK